MANQTGNIVPAITPFLFEGEGLVRVVRRDGEPWFVAADVCRALGIKQATKAVERLDEDEKWVTNSHPFFDEKTLWLIAESGLYALIMRSHGAMIPGTVQHRFRKWVTAEVLPSIRKTGGYRLPRQGLTPEERAERSAERAELARERAEQRRFDNYMRERADALRERAAALRERQQWTRELHQVRMSGVSRAEVAKAAREFCRRIGIDLDATLAQGELPLDETKIH